MSTMTLEKVNACIDTFKVADLNVARQAVLSLVESYAAHLARQSEGMSDERILHAMDQAGVALGVAGLPEDDIFRRELREARAALTAVLHNRPAQDELYRHACDSVEEWKRRALDAEESVARMTEAMNDVCGPTFMGEPVLPAQQRAQEKAEPVASTEPLLRSIALNYGNSPHLWDRLVKEACLRAADEIKALRSAPPAERVRVPEIRVLDTGAVRGEPNVFYVTVAGHRIFETTGGRKAMQTCMGLADELRKALSAAPEGGDHG